MHMLNIKISDELHKRFKNACWYDRKIMSELVRAWIEKYVDQVEKKLKSK
jgi:predicted DNA-binding protein